MLYFLYFLTGYEVPVRLFKCFATFWMVVQSALIISDFFD